MSRPAAYADRSRLTRRVMTYRYCPLFDLRLVSSDLTLRPMTEADLATIADLLPDDREQDPAAKIYDFGGDRPTRASSRTTGAVSLRSTRSAPPCGSAPGSASATWRAPTSPPSTLR